MDICALTVTQFFTMLLLLTCIQKKIHSELGLMLLICQRKTTKFGQTSVISWFSTVCGVWKCCGMVISDCVAWHGLCLLWLISLYCYLIVINSICSFYKHLWKGMSAYKASLPWLGIFSYSCMDSPFTVPIHCTSYLSPASDPSPGFHRLMWHTISSLRSHICPGFQLFTTHCLHVLCTPEFIPTTASKSGDFICTSLSYFFFYVLLSLPFCYKLTTVCTNKILAVE